MTDDWLFMDDITKVDIKIPFRVVWSRRRKGFKFAGTRRICTRADIALNGRGISGFIFDTAWQHAPLPCYLQEGFVQNAALASYRQAQIAPARIAFAPNWLLPAESATCGRTKNRYRRMFIAARGVTGANESPAFTILSRTLFKRTLRRSSIEYLQLQQLISSWLVVTMIADRSVYSVWRWTL